MKLIRYGVTLKRIREEDLELVRYWRNSQKIRENMIYREYITPEMQKKWFDGINNYNNFFYIIQYNNDNIGLIDNKNTDWNLGSTESGLFLFDEKYYNTHIPIAASFILIEIGFYILNGKDSHIKVLRSNKKAINYNLKLGFVPFSDDPGKDYIEFILTRENFQKKTLKLRKAITSLHSSNDPYLYLILDPEDYKSGLAGSIEKVIDGLPAEYIVSNKMKIKEKIVCFNF
jgi:RimJ/RimL family protein N-acetyltransferase